MHLLLLVALALALLVVAGLAYQLVGTRRDWRRLRPPGHLVDVDGCRMHVYCLGQGSPSVVCESGIATSSLNWRHLQQELARTTHVCAYDRSGFAWSAPRGGRRTAAGEARSLMRLLVAAEIPPPWILVGHSYGGFIVLLAAVEHRRDVAGLVLVDPITSSEWRSPDAEWRRRLAGGLTLSWTGAVLASVGVIRFLLNRLVGGQPKLPRAVLGRFGAEATRLVERIVGEVAKFPSDVWPAVRAHWSRPSSFITMAQFLRDLPASAVEVDRALESASARNPGAAALGDLPLVVLAAAPATDANAPARMRSAGSRRAARS